MLKSSNTMSCCSLAVLEFAWVNFIQWFLFTTSKTCCAHKIYQKMSALSMNPEESRKLQKHNF